MHARTFVCMCVQQVNVLMRWQWWKYVYQKYVCAFFVLLVDLSLSFIWCKHIETQKEMGLPFVQMLTRQKERVCCELLNKASCFISWSRCWVLFGVLLFI